MKLGVKGKKKFSTGKIFYEKIRRLIDDATPGYATPG
jgi:hypothetical protein